MALSKAKIHEYLNSLGNVCPYCDAPNIEDHNPKIDRESGYIRQLVKCHVCGKEWIDEYELKQIKEYPSESLKPRLARVITKTFRKSPCTK